MFQWKACPDIGSTLCVVSSAVLWSWKPCLECEWTLPHIPIPCNVCQRASRLRQDHPSGESNIAPSARGQNSWRHKARLHSARHWSRLSFPVGVTHADSHHFQPATWRQRFQPSYLDPNADVLTCYFAANLREIHTQPYSDLWHFKTKIRQESGGIEKYDYLMKTKLAVSTEAEDQQKNWTAQDEN